MKERRAYPRYPITFPVKVLLAMQEGNVTFETECVNISRSSIEVSCDNTLVEALLAQEDYPHTATLEFNMPGYKILFAIHSQVVTHRRLSQNHFYLVLVFNEFRDGSDELLAEYLKDFHPDSFRMDSVSPRVYA